VIVIAPPPDNELTASDLDDLLRETLGRSSLKDAVAHVVEATGLPRREVYRRALELAKTDGENS
jgi:16S rRNA (cytidine1402-2'-O)-methyltransferase